MDYLFDVFVSYSSKDANWVREWLIPRLKKDGLRVAIDYETFDIGVAALTNMERAVIRSRKVLIVLTDHWVASEWSNFEGLMAQSEDPAAVRRKVLVLMLERCKAPASLAMRTWADFNDVARRDAQMARLLDAVHDRLKLVQAVNGGVSDAQPLPPGVANPFGDAGRITDPERFYDREELLRVIFEELRKGVNVSLVGESQVGKSSVLSMVCSLGPERLQRQPDQFGYLSLQMVDNEDDFYAALADVLGLGETKRGFALTRALSGRRFVLCLDEMEKMTWQGFTVKVRDHLRGLADGPGAPLKLVIASRTPLHQLFPDSPELGSPLAGICHTIEVKPFSEAVARAFLTARLESAGVACTAEEIDALLEQGTCHPARLQRAAFDWFERRRGARDGL